MKRTGAVLQAFVYLQAVSFFNSLRQRVRRLRQPKYLFGAIVGCAYLYFFLFRRVMHAGATGHGGANSGMPSALATLFPTLAALALLGIVAYAWLVPSDRAALRFSEAEVAFLFPAPVTRTTLIQYSLLRSQLMIFFSAFLMSLLLRRSTSGGNPWQYATGLWLVMSTLNLHFLGASFARERLLTMGVRPLLRRIVVGSVLLILAGGCWWWLRSRIAIPTRDELIEPMALLHYAGTVLETPPLSWLLAPFKILAEPIFARGLASFLRASAPALLLLAAHYVWVVRSDVSFEEVSIDLARKRAERITAMREGKLRVSRAPSKPRTAPFRLAPQGFAPIAFLWKGLIAMGSFWRLRTWLIACVIAIGGCHWLAADPARKPLLRLVGVLVVTIGAYLLLLGPILMRRSLRVVLDRLDILKSGPLRGWQIVLGELLTPVTVMSFAQWFLLLVAYMAFGERAGAVMSGTANFVIAVAGFAVVSPLLLGLMLCVPFAGLLYFPAWSARGRAAGIEMMGQGLIFLGAYLLALALSLLPAAVLGALVFVLVKWLSNLTFALLAAMLMVGTTLALELVGAVDWLGRRIERFDVSQELQ